MSQRPTPPRPVTDRKDKARQTDMTPRKELLEHIPNMRAFAMSLCGSADKADDLVQEALVKAWSNLDSYREGTNMRAWLFTILRNAFYSDLRKRRREVEDIDGAMAAQLATHPEQGGHMDFRDFQAALDRLPPDQREALVLVGASGLSYEEAAEICACAVGTVKSRVNRARQRLAELLTLESAAEFGPDPTSQPIVSPTGNSRSVA